MRGTWWLIVLLAGCDPGMISSGGQPQSDASANPGVDSSGSGVPDASLTGTDAGNGCINKQPSPGSGHHNPGQDCMNGCHNHGFTVAGTVFSTVNGGTAVIGATVRVHDAAGQTVDMVSMTNGNFYTSTPLTYPITVLATSCPNIQPMSASVAGPGPVGCNRTGCHVSNNRIHLP